MESRRPGPRAGPGQACPGHHGRNPQHSVPRNWIRRLYQKTFYFHFQNLPRAFGRHNTFLCYQVEGSRGSSPDKGIFMNQMRPRAPKYHAELSFLSWFENCLPLPAQQPYQVTWYLSWSPCSRCAEWVAAFLDTHRNVSLTIYTARLYYHWHPEYRAGLFRLVSAGAQVAAMSFSEFEKCWEEFVYNDGTPFRPWRMLYRNYCVQAHNLQDILSGAVGLLKEETFCFQFNNQRQVPKTHRRRRPYLCYQLATPTGSLLHRGYLCNQEDRHVEVCLIDKIQSMGLDPAQSYQLTCYLSWSPCPRCARELLDFASSHRNLGLRIFASRLYFHWRRNFQQGLYLLCKAHVPVTVMGLPEFQHCWKTFVDQAKPFPAWPKLPERSASIKNRLQRILKSWSLSDS
ncbi:DNA dC-_dU-editing enzyme APOBEC-3-like isoform X2 [Lepus europaeus]|uniref:DNA dC->dU-editing enzyme APOBEC-3-like isoform X2 n=1 Tax=Lepus europaeus TaxID=9983 RepID=UPI002B49DCD6|nr:DNA dC->dU-editing enzyme APOBEC-3-like isoform X2 [Lepus europaeus]